MVAFQERDPIGPHDSRRAALPRPHHEGPGFCPGEVLILRSLPKAGVSKDGRVRIARTRFRRYVIALPPDCSAGGGGHS
jgi:hypothetical protein